MSLHIVGVYEMAIEYSEGPQSTTMLRAIKTDSFSSHSFSILFSSFKFMALAHLLFDNFTANVLNIFHKVLLNTLFIFNLNGGQKLRREKKSAHNNNNNMNDSVANDATIKLRPNNNKSGNTNRDE